MGVSLRFDVNAFMDAYIVKMIDVMNTLMREFYNEATSGFDSAAKQASVLVPAAKKQSSEEQGYREAAEFISARCEFYADALMQSFGVGSEADTSEKSYWSEYKAMTGTEFKNLFNPARKGTEIAGRPKGNYVDIWGNRRYSRGKFEGLGLEGAQFIDRKTGKVITIEPRKPSGTIQKAEVWLKQSGQTKVERRIKMETERFLQQEAGKYFVEVSF